MATFEPVWAMGMMSGTSLDGVDAATVLADGHLIHSFGPSAYRAYSASDQKALRAGLTEAAARQSELLSGQDPGSIPALLEVSNVIEASHSAIAKDLAARRSGISVLGLHCQTVLHRPDAGYTLQLPQVLPDRMPWQSWDVVTDFRSADVAAGGQGAPLAPFFHFACAKYAGLMECTAFLNLGGVGNVTVVDPTFDQPEQPGALLAFDTGPANAPLNDFVAQFGDRFDRDGQLAAQGAVDEDILRHITARAYFDRPAPKSLDRNDFVDVLQMVDGLSIENAAATLTALPAACCAAALQHLPKPPLRWLVSGGGARNPVMMQALRDRLDAQVEPIEAIGLDGDMLEAQAFAYLAVRALRGLPLSAPSTTGVPRAVSGGRIVRRS